MDKTIDQLLSELTLDEKVSLVCGDGMWTTPPVERLGVPSLKVTDGPNGARGDGLMGSGTRTLCIPCGSALGATWDPELITELGVALGEEAIAKGAHVLLAPTINMHRHPLGGRNFECYSEDPLLSGKTAAAFIRGVQSQGVATTAKHFAANDAEFERNSINTVADERTLREIYLRPFEIAVTEGGAWGIMSAYNQLNGVFCSENNWLLTQVLRDDWGFDGFVVTDWFAAKSTAATANSGLDLEMPGPGNKFGAGQLQAAVEAGEVAAEQLDAMVANMLRLMERTGAFERPPGDEELELDRPDHTELARRASVCATVLLKNEGVVPLDVSALSTVAVIGPNTDRAQIMGGGSAALLARTNTTPLQALRNALEPDVQVTWARGVNTDRTAPLVRGVGTLEYFVDDYEGDPVSTSTSPNMRQITFTTTKEIPENWLSRMTTTWTAPESGRFTLSLMAIGAASLTISGARAIDLPAEAPRGDMLFGMGSEPVEHALEVAEGDELTFVVETAAGGPMGPAFGGFQLGVFAPEPADMIEKAVALAAEADAAIVVVGTNDDWETEGRDRDFMALPGDQAELIRRVAAANPKTIVAVNAGSPVTMDWVHEVPAAMQIWFGGEGMADGLADIVTGAASPGGRMPLTVPLDPRHVPSHANFPGENGEVRYGEGIFTGYRGYEHTDRAVAFPFGHGLSTTTFELSAPRLSATELTDSETLSITVEVEVTNTGTRAGAEVVQLYTSCDAPVLARPPKELAAYRKLYLEPGESAVATMELDRRAFAYFDPADAGYAERSSGGPVPAGGGASHRAEPGWYVDPGTHTISVGRSSADIVHTASLTITTN